VRQDAGDHLLHRTVAALQDAARSLDGYGGIWIDWAPDPVINVAVTGTWPDEVVQHLRSLVPAGQEFVLREVAVSLAELESLQERLTDVVLSDPVLRGHLVELGSEPQINAVRLTMLTGTPQELLDRVAQDFGGPGFVLDSASEQYRTD
jgi:hypothetical protein